MPSSTFALLLERTRLERDMTLQEVASELGVSRQAIHGLETGNRIPKPALAAAVAEALSVDPMPFVAASLDDLLRHESLEYCVKLQRARR